MTILMIVAAMTIQCSPGGTIYSKIEKLPAVVKHRKEQLRKKHEQVIEAYARWQTSDRSFQLRQAQRIASLRQIIEQIEQKGDPADAEFAQRLREMVTIMSNFNRKLSGLPPEYPDK